MRDGVARPVGIAVASRGPLPGHDGDRLRRAESRTPDDLRQYLMRAPSRLWWLAREGPVRSATGAAKQQSRGLSRACELCARSRHLRVAGAPRDGRLSWRAEVETFHAIHDHGSSVT